MADQLAACMAEGFEEPFWADLPDGSTREYVGGLAADPDWDDGVDGLTAKYQIQFFCSDPRSYGERRSFTQAAPGLLEVFNRGTFEARPVVSMTATAAMAGYQFKLFDGARQLGNLRMNGIASGQTVAVDMASGRTTLNGVPTGGLIHSGDRWGVPPGRVLQVMLERNGEIGAGRLAVVTRDTFI
ncbi:hypothetical protein [Pseudoclavibacter helvolus]|uniref:hypothetical protein n=1 Tax=Pseudoclavibacter helvolus TaxID=255205 RepID=UPI003C7829D2